MAATLTELGLSNVDSMYVGEIDCEVASSEQDGNKRGYLKAEWRGVGVRALLCHTTVSDEGNGKKNGNGDSHAQRQQTPLDLTPGCLRLRGLRHPCLVHVLGVSCVHRTPAIVFEEPGDPLESCLEQQLSLSTACEIMLNITTGLHHLHTERMSHRRIAAENVYVRHGVAKLDLLVSCSASSEGSGSADSSDTPCKQRAREESHHFCCDHSTAGSAEADILALGRLGMRVLGRTEETSSAPSVKKPRLISNGDVQLCEYENECEEEMDDTAAGSPEVTACALLESVFSRCMDEPAQRPSASQVYKEIRDILDTLCQPSAQQQEGRGDHQRHSTVQAKLDHHSKRLAALQKNMLHVVNSVSQHQHQEQSRGAHQQQMMQAIYDRVATESPPANGNGGSVTTAIATADSTHEAFQRRMQNIESTVHFLATSMKKVVDQQGTLAANHDYLATGQREMTRQLQLLSSGQQVASGCLNEMSAASQRSAHTLRQLASRFNVSSPGSHNNQDKQQMHTRPQPGSGFRKTAAAKTPSEAMSAGVSSPSHQYTYSTRRSLMPGRHDTWEPSILETSAKSTPVKKPAFSSQRKSGESSSQMSTGISKSASASPSLPYAAAAAAAASASAAAAASATAGSSSNSSSFMRTSGDAMSTVTPRRPDQYHSVHSTGGRVPSTYRHGHGRQVAAASSRRPPHHQQQQQRHQHQHGPPAAMGEPPQQAPATKRPADDSAMDRQRADKRRYRDPVPVVSRASYASPKPPALIVPHTSSNSSTPPPRSSSAESKKNSSTKTESRSQGSRDNLTLLPSSAPATASYDVEVGGGNQRRHSTGQDEYPCYLSSPEQEDDDFGDFDGNDDMSGVPPVPSLSPASGKQQAGQHYDPSVSDNTGASSAPTGASPSGTTAGKDDSSSQPVAASSGTTTAMSSSQQTPAAVVVTQSWAASSQGRRRKSAPTSSRIATSRRVQRPPTKKRPVFPPEVTQVMKDWLKDNYDNPYPTEPEKKVMAQQTNLTMQQIDYWFVNARRRLVQPMREQAAREGKKLVYVDMVRNRRRITRISSPPSALARSQQQAPPPLPLHVFPDGATSAAGIAQGMPNQYAMTEYPPGSVPTMQPIVLQHQQQQQHQHHHQQQQQHHQSVPFPAHHHHQHHHQQQQQQRHDSPQYPDQQHRQGMAPPAWYGGQDEYGHDMDQHDLYEQHQQSHDEEPLLDVDDSPSMRSQSPLGPTHSHDSGDSAQ